MEATGCAGADVREELIAALLRDDALHAWQEDVISAEEMVDSGENYKRIAGFEREALRNRPSLV